MNDDDTPIDEGEEKKDSKESPKTEAEGRSFKDIPPKDAPDTPAKEDAAKPKAEVEGRSFKDIPPKDAPDTQPKEDVAEPKAEAEGRSFKDIPPRDEPEPASKEDAAEPKAEVEGRSFKDIPPKEEPVSASEDKKESAVSEPEPQSVQKPVEAVSQAKKTVSKKEPNFQEKVVENEGEVVWPEETQYNFMHVVDPIQTRMRLTQGVSSLRQRINTANEKKPNDDLKRADTLLREILSAAELDADDSTAGEKEENLEG